MANEVGKRLIAGAMSGTSADGVDVAIVEVAGRGLAMTAMPLSHAYEAFDPQLRARILDMRQRGEARFADIAQIGREVTLAHVRAFRAAIEKAGVTATTIAAIGAHGQTLWHGPPNTIQYFDPSLLAIETGCSVVSDFRRADLAVGGQGAPLVPFADWILFRHPTKSRVILNIGGIANITYLKAGGTIDEVIAFDTGPGNCLSDWLCQHSAETAEPFDRGGGIAMVGAIDGSPEAARFCRDLCLAFDDFAMTLPPKSTDGPAMIALFEEQLRKRNEPVRFSDQLAAANEIVVNCIFRIGLRLQLLVDMRHPRDADNEIEWFAAGGGVENAYLWKTLNRYIAPMQRTETVGISSDAREAIAFALLAAATLDGEPSNVPSATGASRRVILGSITPRPIHS